MDNYLEIANSPGMWLACSAIIVVVLVQVVRLTRISFKAGREIGMSKQDMVKAFRIGFTTSLVPAIAILLGLALLIPRLGLPFPWMRLSVIGSVSYELIAAGIAAGEFGLEGLTTDINQVIFTTIVWTMSLGAVLGLIVVAFFTPSIHKLKNKVAGGDEVWMQVMTAAAFFGAVAYMVAQPVIKGGAPLVALLGGFFSMVLIGVMITVGRQGWLKEWALALAIVLGMVAAGVGFHYFGIGG
ncbi:DUF5058 family protein [bacterium]|nr:DUF5058 family protein [bacterium]